MGEKRPFRTPNFEERGSANLSDIEKINSATEDRRRDNNRILSFKKEFKNSRTFGLVFIAMKGKCAHADFLNKNKQKMNFPRFTIDVAQSIT
jgi:hypothetical protein